MSKFLDLQSLQSDRRAGLFIGKGSEARIAGSKDTVTILL